MQARRVKIFKVTVTVDEQTGRVSQEVEQDPSTFEVRGSLTVDQARAEVRRLLEKKGFRVRNISFTVDGGIVAYVAEGPPANAATIPGWVGKRPARQSVGAPARTRSRARTR